MKAFLYRLSLYVALVICFAGRSHALTSSWIGQGTTNNWSDPGNWDVYPTSPFDLIFATINARTTNSNDFSPGLSINSLTFNSSAAAFTLQGNPIGFFSSGTNTITNNSSNLQTLSFNDNAGESGITFGGFDGTIDAANGDFNITSNVAIITFSGHQALTVTGSHNTTISGVVNEDSGLASELIKNGSGALELTGSNTYTGHTTINAGTLVVGNINALGVEEPNIFATDHNDVFLNGGTLQTQEGVPRIFRAPDNYTQTGGTLRLQIGGLTPGTTADQMQVGRSANLGGMLFIHQINNFMPTSGDRVTIITTNNGTTPDFGGRPPGVVNGTFASFADDFPGLISAVPEYFSDRVDIVFQVLAFSDLTGLTANQRAVANALDQAGIDNCAPNLIAFLGTLPTTSLPEAFDLIAPEELASVYDIGFSQAVVHNQNLMRRMDDIRAGANGYCGPVVEVPTGKDSNPPINDKNVIADKNAVMTPTVLPPEECKWNVFATGFGDFANINDDDENAPGYEIRTGGVIAGVDRRFGDHFAIGLDGSYSGSSADLVNDGRVDVDGGKGGAYATVFGKGFFGSRFYVDGAVSGGWNNYDTRRTTLALTPNGLGDARSDFDGTELDGLVAYGADWTFGCFNVGTWSSFQYTKIDIDSHNESGSLAPLHFPDQDQDSIRATTGLHASYDLHAGRMLIRPEVRSAWLHEYGDRAYAIDARFLDCDHGFTVHGPDIGRDAALVGAGLSVQLRRCLAIYAYYDGVLGRDNYDNNAVSGGLRVGF
jgi:outer membrane autotransporter protein